MERQIFMFRCAWAYLDAFMARTLTSQRCHANGLQRKAILEFKLGVYSMRKRYKIPEISHRHWLWSLIL
jgi:hypothetical protein